jgi:hypothetical protein
VPPPAVQNIVENCLRPACESPDWIPDYKVRYRTNDSTGKNNSQQPGERLKVIPHALQFYIEHRIDFTPQFNSLEY